MNIPVIRPAPEEPTPLRLLKTLARELLHLDIKARMLLDPAYPWLNQGAVSFLRGWLRPEMNGFEWGSGRSTIFLAKRTRSLISVEHKKKWHRRVMGMLERHKLGNAEVLLLPPLESPPPPSPLRPASWSTYRIEVRKPEFTAYFDRILEYPQESFDYVLIDGRARVECAANALDRLVPGGILVLDNSEWPKYRPVFEMTRDWTSRIFSNGVWATTIFTRP